MATWYTDVSTNQQQLLNFPGESGVGTLTTQPGTQNRPLLEGPPDVVATYTWTGNEAANDIINICIAPAGVWFPRTGCFERRCAQLHTDVHGMATTTCRVGTPLPIPNSAAVTSQIGNSTTGICHAPDSVRARRMRPATSFWTRTRLRPPTGRTWRSRPRPRRRRPTARPTRFGCHAGSGTRIYQLRRGSGECRVLRRDAPGGRAALCPSELGRPELGPVEPRAAHLLNNQPYQDSAGSAGFKARFCHDQHDQPERRTPDFRVPRRAERPELIELGIRLRQPRLGLPVAGGLPGLFILTQSNMPNTSLSPTDICNLSLSKIGAAPINSIGDLTNNSAIVCNTNFQLAYLEVSRATRWNSHPCHGNPCAGSADAQSQVKLPVSSSSPSRHRLPLKASLNSYFNNVRIPWSSRRV